MHLLPLLRDLKNELLQFRSCMCISKPFFGLRMCLSIHMEKTTIWFYKELWGGFKGIMVGGVHLFRDLQSRVTFFHIMYVGLGLYSAVETDSYTFVASRAQSWVLRNHIDQLESLIICQNSNNGKSQVSISRVVWWYGVIVSIQLNKRPRGFNLEFFFTIEK